ncbi:MAG: hypothetical protein PUK66_01030 [Bacteroidales bacterium]|uniref:hypothetical protein n=1 Tax=Porphyromonas sp. TaxID=1924944 RepID=UPI002975A006|nr:hypothetical protein [Porphyromonas sp.]MDD7437415.1 hypothetical protein [Bacteroidales bacterium]MDY3067087.1 hypothetical protein [Porphyromonas sp.]
MVIGERVSNGKSTARATVVGAVGYSFRNNPARYSSHRHTLFDWQDSIGVALAPSQYLGTLHLLSCDGRACSCLE